jgi:hypothetical protein
MMSTGFGFCPTCGTPRTAAEQKFCAVCGSAFAAGAAPAPPVAPVAAAVPPVAPPPWSTPPAGEATAPSAWAAPPAVPGGAAAQATPAAPPSYPPAYPDAPVPTVPIALVATSAGHKSRRPLLLLGGLVLAAIVGAFVYMNMGSMSGSISYSPSTISCSSTASMTVTIRLPSSLNATDQIIAQLDGQVRTTATVGSQFIQQSDGSWLQTTTQSASSACGSLSRGTHVGRVLDPSGKVLAESSFTLTS